MSGLAGYDAWKLASPPEYDAPDCDGECVDACECAARRDREREEAYDRHVDAQIDAARERELEEES